MSLPNTRLMDDEKHARQNQRLDDGSGRREPTESAIAGPAPRSAATRRGSSPTAVLMDVVEHRRTGGTGSCRATVFIAAPKNEGDNGTATAMMPASHASDGPMTDQLGQGAAERHPPTRGVSTRTENMADFGRPAGSTPGTARRAGCRQTAPPESARGSEECRWSLPGSSRLAPTRSPTKDSVRPIKQHQRAEARRCTATRGRTEIRLRARTRSPSPTRSRSGTCCLTCGRPTASQRQWASTRKRRLMPWTESVADRSAPDIAAK